MLKLNTKDLNETNQDGGGTDVIILFLYMTVNDKNAHTEDIELKLRLPD